ncbi:MAG: fatty acid hydroxylase [Candidatus Binatia bacterium]
MTVQILLSGLLTCSVSFVVFSAYASFFEWALHKYIMHTQNWEYPFTAHALTHHGLFRADYTYHLQREGDKKKVTFAWWNAPALVLVQSPLLVLVWYVFGGSAVFGGLLAMVADYVLYEWLHWCMHVPQDRWIERTWVFQWLNAHHHYHHLYAFKNLNVVLPLADWVMGTLVLVPAKNPTFEQKKAA